MRFPWSLLASTAILLTGCSVTKIASQPPVTAPSEPAVATPLHGLIHGGQQPIQSAHVYLLAAATGGYGQTSSSLLKSTADTSNAGGVNGWYYVTTNASGVFDIKSTDFTCTSGQQVYLYSLGGNSGSGTNSVAGLMAVLGQCGASSKFTGLPANIVINEETTVGAAYALAGYATSATQMSGNQFGFQSGTSGLANAAGNAPNLVNLGSGLAYATTPGGNGIVPQAEINTLADILAACINSAGTASSGCTTLLADAKSAGSTGTTATDTATAAINIAHNPAANVAALFGLANSTSPFQPILTAAPNDWTIGITYSDISLYGVSFVAVDAFGDVWVTNNDGNSISEFSGSAFSGSPGFTLGSAPATGALLHTTTAGGLKGPNCIAMDGNNNVWVANGGQQGVGSSLSEFDSSANANLASPYTGGGLDYPWGVAVDPNNNIWIANFGANIGPSLSEYVPGTGFTNYTSASLDNPLFIASDSAGRIWVTNSGGGTGTSFDEYAPPGTDPNVTGFANFPGYGQDDPVGVAIDSGNDVWVINEFNNALTTMNYYYYSDLVQNNDPTSDAFASPTGGGLNRSEGLALDGNSNAWIANYTGSTVSEFNVNGVAVSGTNGYQYGTGSLSGPQGIAVDPSGNVWVADNSANTVTEIVGVATPVITPIAVAVQSYTLGQAP
jgi:streptogramin lyase